MIEKIHLDNYVEEFIRGGNSIDIAIGVFIHNWIPEDFINSVLTV